VKKLTIRKPRIDDADDITRIHAAITRSPVKIDYRRVIKEQRENTLEASYVAEHQGRVIGYMISHVLFGGFGIESSAWIAMFGIDPKYMGEGVGKRLANEIFRFYRKRGIKHIYTSVRWDSTDLLSFFRAMGFDRSGFINLEKILD
jgi:ribosomal protein S18 acetylase RimI-like enzyme